MADDNGLRRRVVQAEAKNASDSVVSEKFKRKGHDDESEDEDVTFEPKESEWPFGTYWLTRAVCLRAIAFIYFVAFLVALNQNRPLIGQDGILPASKHLHRYHAHFKGSLMTLIQVCPTLLWLTDIKFMNWWLDAIAYAGILLSGLVMYIGGANIFMMAGLWILYHSITNVGQTWYGFGWESQLLETGFLAIFFCPILSVKPFPEKTPPPFIVVAGYRWLLFRIMLGAGLIKIRGDKCWKDLTCMNYHYQTQPVPNPLSYYMHQSPTIVHMAETAGNHIVELVMPFFLFWPRATRRWAGLAQIIFQVILVLSGNLSFLNWLTMIPAICCFDDASIQWMFTEKSRRAVRRIMHMRKIKGRRHTASFGDRFRHVVNFLLFCLIAYLSVPVVNNMLSRRQAMNRSFDSLRIVNTYGAFGSVTKIRNEVIIQGTYSENPHSEDAIWLEYEFKCKPGNVTRRPCIISPYHYRLDWLMWFAAFQDAQSNPWFIHLLAKLLINDPGVTSLLHTNPFDGGTPPRFIRAELYKYKYTNIGSAAAKSGKWWRRKRVDSYLPPVDISALKDYLFARGFDIARIK